MPVQDRPSDIRQTWRDNASLLTPTAEVEVKARSIRSRHGTGGQGSHDLSLSVGEDRPEAELPGQPRRADAEKHLSLRSREATQLRSISLDQSETAALASLSVDWYARLSQGREISVDSSLGHLELRGHLRRGHRLT
jgi:hypothetical protein